MAEGLFSCARRAARRACVIDYDTGAANLILSQWSRLLHSIISAATASSVPPSGLDVRVAAVEPRVWDTEATTLEGLYDEEDLVEGEQRIVTASDIAFTMRAGSGWFWPMREGLLSSVNEIEEEEEEAEGRLPFFDLIKHWWRETQNGYCSDGSAFLSKRALRFASEVILMQPFTLGAFKE